VECVLDLPSSGEINIIQKPADIPGNADARRAQTLLFHSRERAEPYEGARRAAFPTERTQWDIDLMLREGTLWLITPLYKAMKIYRGKLFPSGNCWWKYCKGLV